MATICTNVTNGCFDNGLCSPETGYCECLPYFAHETNCEKSIFDLYEDKDLFYPIIMIILTLILLIFIGLEALADIRLKKKRARPAFLCKVALIVYCFLRIVFYALYTSLRNNTDLKSIGVIDGIIFNLALIPWASAFIIMVMAWVDTMQSVKKLGLVKNKGIAMLRWVLLISLLIVSSCMVLFFILRSVGFQPKLFTNLYNVLVALYYLCTSITVTVFLVKTWRIIGGLERERIRKSLQKKTILLALTMSSGICGILVLGIYSIVSAGEDIWLYVVFHFILKLLELSAVTFQFFFLERFATKFPFMVGYLHVLNFQTKLLAPSDISNSSSSSQATKTTQTQKHKTRRLAARGLSSDTED
eukprot:TRINITY_DN2627_c0_g1_i1.p1 TRINITY_DN2627_c0_g1~~TRINITY_DN2627_c0_g1_i1.p1  ORF type:complete len:390 (+),score=53.62 TRINITY_DN2627_c0_g1_i1:92-1171(+)